MEYKSKKVAIIGAGIEGLDAKKFLEIQGAQVNVLDQKDGSNYLDELDKYEIIVRSPGVYPLKTELIEAKNKGILITSPTNIFLDEFKGKTIGVTGTKGKGTTSTLIYEILKSAGKDAYLGGNIGKPLLELLPKLNNNSIVVMEMSSFQLMDLQKSPNISVVLNITSDHMDWHKDLNEYIDAKKNIVRHQTKDDWAIINSEYKNSKDFAAETNAHVVFYSNEDLGDVYKTDLTLRGEHNFENIAAAVSVAKVLEIDESLIVNTVKSFKGLEHRLEFVGEVDEIKFYNDSFATGPQPTIAAIKSFSEDETLILGGSDKGLDYSDLGNIINKTKNVKNIILIGQIREKIKEHIKDKNIIDMGESSMDEIVKKAFSVTGHGGVVVLTPAAASFDMFKDYKDRGNQFKMAVKNLKI